MTNRVRFSLVYYPMLISLVFLTSLGARQLLAQTPVSAQADSSTSLRPAELRQAASPVPGTSAVGDLYRRDCARCHGADGTGSRARRRYPEIPDFTNTSWQAEQASEQLTESIVDGKGSTMPSASDEISEGQVRELVAYVRAFAPNTGKSRQAEQEGPVLDELSEAGPPRGFFAKLIRWLGKFHPPAVHFPIALLTAAAVAELLRIVTGKPPFDAISRYCIWFGTLTAVPAGALGWFLGGFHLTDVSWVMMTHRWLGTFTVAWAALVLALCEASRHPARLRTRMCFRVTLLVVAMLVSVTGFLGGAMVFGLDHYNWPR
jgi:uncharacterized membrane protein/mono/diheme cytochrome c family protein